MILLVSGSTVSVRKQGRHPHLGVLVTPRAGSPVQAAATGLPWAADNDCFQSLDRAQYLAMLRALGQVDRSQLRFVTVPDVVGDARATLLRFEMWQPVLRYYGLPVALVAQDGQEAQPVPWDRIDALFIGGTTAWKEGPHAARLMLAAKERGKWVHVGRVNTLRRKNLIGALDADSFDGTAFSRYGDRYIPWMLRELPYKQHGFMEVLCSSPSILPRS